MSYATKEDVENRFGKSAVKKWASLEGSTSKVDINTKVTTALTDAETEINDVLRGGPYAIPFGIVPARIKKETARLAGVILFEARGIELEEESDDSETIANVRRSIMDTIRKIKHGGIQLEIAIAHKMHPEVVKG